MDSSSSNNNDQSNSNKSVVVKKNRYGKIVKVNDKGNKSKSKHGAGHVASTSMAVDASERKKRSASVDEDNNNNNFDSTSAIASQANSSSSSAAALSSSSASSSKKQPLKKKTRAKASGNDMETDDKRKNNITTTNSGHNNNSNSNNEDDDDLDEDMVEDEFEEEVQITSEEQNELGEDDDDEDDNKNIALFRPGVDELEEGEKLDYDPSTYVMLHRMQFDWSCFSFDFLKDNYGPLRTRFPLSTFIVAGTQAAEADGNQLIITKLSDMNKTRFREDADDGEMSDDDEDDEGVDDDPVIQTKKIKHVGGVNRVRSMPQKSEIVATWSETGSVFIWDLSSKLKTMNFFVEDIKSIPTSAQDVEAMLSKDLSPIFTFKGHKDEGFAMDWSIARPGRFASADLRKSIYIWDISSSGITVDPKPFNSHDGSVEDVQWSPNEETVLASCSVDQTVRIWDIRQKKSQMLSVHAHDTDVNVLSWNPTVSYLLVSGADDGSFKVWDLRKFKETESIGHFKWHTGPITSIQWNPNDESVLAVTGDDNQTSIWDLALEDDPEHARATAGLDEAAYDLHGNQLSIPPQLLFLHQGQTNPKDVRFHPQIPGLVGTTAEDGFNVFICEPFDYLYKTKSAKV